MARSEITVLSSILAVTATKKRKGGLSIQISMRLSEDISDKPITPTGGNTKCAFTTDGFIFPS